MSIESSSLPPLDPKELQNERFQDDFGTQVNPKEKVKKKPVDQTINKVFKEKSQPKDHK